MKKMFLIFCFAALPFLAPVLFAQNADIPEITAAEIQDHINYLASDEMKGRFTGSEEAYTAAEYIKSEFERHGLKPAFGDSYIQEYPFIAGIEMTGKNELSFYISGNESSPKLKEEFTPAPFSGSGDVKAQLVFAGYGISAQKLEYDDYAGIDVTDKIVLVMRSQPEYNVPHSKFDEYSSLRYKATVARDKGAAGIIFVNGYLPENENDKLLDFTYDRASAVEGFPVVQVKRSFVDELFDANKLSFADYQKKMIDDKKPASFEFENVNAKIVTGIKETEKISWNVAGILEGNDAELKNEYVVVGGHFDHLGMGETGSLYMGDVPMIHNGADDNASGTTGVLELAEKFSSEKDNLKRSMLFACFSGEELGLLGSNYFANHPPVEAKQMITMINLDMIGRLNAKNELIIYGTGTSSNFKNLLNEKNSYGLSLTFNDEGYGPSDHSSFYGKEIPVLFFFTGTHSDYHKPSDDADKINSVGEETVLKYIFDVANKIVTDNSKPDYLVVERKDTGQMTGTKVWVGTIPDFAGDVDGYKLSGVTDGSPAAKAGILAGDIIVKFGEKKISNIYDFTYAIGDYVPGDKVDVVIVRDEKEMKFNIELGTR
ncbi:MAG: M28 family peptidase [Ignavibacteriaceae bacterium]|nr:M28 family peptidase [Ignavibacteriaceae bacterium]